MIADCVHWALPLGDGIYWPEIKSSASPVRVMVPSASVCLVTEKLPSVLSILKDTPEMACFKPIWMCRGNKMAGSTKNLCAQIPVELHNRLRAEQERSGLTLSTYMTDLLTNYYKKGSEQAVEGMRTMAFQMPEEMFRRLKKHLERESQRTGKKVSQKQFMLDLIRRALYEAEQTDAADQMGVLQAR